MNAIKNYLSLVKFSHTIFAMPFALIGFALAIKPLLMLNNLYNENPQMLSSFKPIWLVFILVIVCMITARNAAMAFNRLIDKSYDTKNHRTAIREIPKGIISPNNALLFVVINCLIFMICTWFINRVCFYLSPVALFVGMLIYQHSIVKPDDLRRVNIAFMTANGIASVVFAVFVLADMFFAG